MSILVNPVNWTAKYSTLHAWAFGATNKTTRWADQDAPRPDYPYVLLDVISTAKEGGIDEATRTVDLTRARNVKITPLAQDATTYTVTINGTAFNFLSDASATVAEIVTGLVAAIAAGAEPVTATDNGTDLDVVGDFETLNPTVLGLFTVVVSEDSGETVTQISYENNDSGNEVRVRVTGSREFTLNVQAFERNARGANAASDPATNAYNTLTLLQASLGLPSVQRTLWDDADIALIEELPIQDLSEQVEDALLSRASMDIRMRTLSVLDEYTGFIEDVSGTGTYAGSSDSPIAEPFSVQS